MRISTNGRDVVSRACTLSNMVQHCFHMVFRRLIVNNDNTQPVTFITTASNISSMGHQKANTLTDEHNHVTSITINCIYAVSSTNMADKGENCYLVSVSRTEAQRLVHFHMTRDFCHVWTPTAQSSN